MRGTNPKQVEIANRVAAAVDKSGGLSPVRELVNGVRSALDDAAAMNDQGAFSSLAYALKMLHEAAGFRGQAAQLRANGHIEDAAQLERYAEQREELAYG
jgi:hypothetical protein